MPDLQFAFYMFHNRSGLNLTTFRPFSAVLARWLSRDPLEEAPQTNLFVYLANNPSSTTDALGLAGKLSICATDMIGGSSLGTLGPGHCWIKWQPSGADRYRGYAGTWGTFGGGSQGAGVYQNREAAEKIPEEACRSKNIGDQAETYAVSEINRYRNLGHAAWDGANNCCKFAHDVWLAGTGEDLPFSCCGNGNPSTVLQAIIHGPTPPKGF